MNSQSNKVTINLINILTGSQVIIIQGQTSLLTVKLLLKEKLNGIVVTEPRRSFPIKFSKSLADELNMKVGNEIGYAIRYEEKVSNKTICKFVTEGCIIRQYEKDNLLNDIRYIIIDDVNKMKSEYTDTTLSKLKNVIAKRKDIKIIFTITDREEDVSKIKEEFKSSIYII